MENSKQLVSVSGMYRTGSSALIDVLRGVENTAFVEHEFKIFESGLYDLIKKIRINEFEKNENGLNKTPRLTQKDLSQTIEMLIKYGEKNIAINVLNRICRGQINALREKKTLFRGYNYCIPNYEFATQTLVTQFSAALEESRLDAKNISAILSNYFREIANYISGSRVIFNQLIKVGHEYLPGLLPDFRIVVVTRDPRDHFCEIVNTSGKKIKYSKNDRAAVFVREYKKRLAEVAPFIASKNVMLVNFEELSLDFEGVLVKLKNFLEFDKFNYNEMNFNRERAISKVGIYKKHAVKWEIDEVESGLSEYLVEIKK